MKKLKTFGSTEGKVSIVDVVNLKIKCRNNEFVNIEALRVPVICSPLLGQKPFEISKIHTEFRKLYQKFIRDLYMGDATNTFKDIDTAIMFYNKIKCIYQKEDLS